MLKLVPAMRPSGGEWSHPILSRRRKAVTQNNYSRYWHVLWLCYGGGCAWLPGGDRVPIFIVRGK